MLHKNQVLSYWGLGILIIGLIVFSSSRCKSRASLSTGKNRAAMRIISLSPNITEILFALQLDSEIAGVTDFCNYPAAACQKVRLGGYANPSLETIVAVNPTLIITLNFDQTLHTKLAAFNFPILTVSNESVADILAAIDTIGTVTGRRRAADSLLASLKATQDSVQRQVHTLPRRRVLLGIGRNPQTLQGLFVAGQGTFLNDLLELAGGENVFADVPLKYPKVALEAIIERNPEIIIEPITKTEVTPAELEQYRQSWSVLPTVDAVRQQRIYFLVGEQVLIPGPRITRTLRQLAAMLHPESATEPTASLPGKR